MDKINFQIISHSLDTMIRELNEESREGKMTILGYKLNEKEIIDKINILGISINVNEKREFETYVVEMVTTTNIHIMREMTIMNMPDSLKLIKSFVRRLEHYHNYLSKKNKEKECEKSLHILQDLYHSRVELRDFYQGTDEDIYNLMCDSVIDYEEKVNKAFKDLEESRIARHDFNDIIGAKILNSDGSNDIESYAIV